MHALVTPLWAGPRKSRDSSRRLALKRSRPTLPRRAVGKGRNSTRFSSLLAARATKAGEKRGRMRKQETQTSVSSYHAATDRIRRKGEPVPSPPPNCETPRGKKESPRTTRFVDRSVISSPVRKKGEKESPRSRCILFPRSRQQKRKLWLLQLISLAHLFIHARGWKTGSAASREGVVDHSEEVMLR